VREFGDSPIGCHIFLTHFHWDHVQGTPFFLPLYRETNEFQFYSVRRQESDLRAAIEGQMANPFFPVNMTILRSVRHFQDIDYGSLAVGAAVVRSAPLNHPQGCAAYRIEADGRVFVLATDTEPGSPLHDRSVRDLAAGADVLVYDAQYTPEQLRSDRKGWGHSSWLEGTRIAKECGVKHLFLFHHDPDHDDEFVDGLVEKARSEFPHTTGAAEGLEVDLPRRAVPQRNGVQSRVPPTRPLPSRAPSPAGARRARLRISSNFAAS
jgi:phosphoribosyl 1,2-cyclic phosphodiesterase